MGGEILKWLTTPCVCFVKEAHVHNGKYGEAGTQLKLFSLSKMVKLRFGNILDSNKCNGLLVEENTLLCKTRG